ncbi:membrane-spanning 4-domains subfamily A member 5 isoform X2 [Oryctolagus cuniculus]|uniref:membrane-spanning 4-domains subfamily A member 5 isoform X2 n=1 Tax=Oryctolagus cuniculus TaxID=9986 RepID=UPI00048B3C88|nr:membrane-spanning 4-domains subfamily A member 5 isoform X2 [Oryctolagus cuniculus]
MNSRDAHSPVFLIFPPEITVPDYQSTVITATSYESQSPLEKLLVGRMKISGTLQILLGIMNFSFGMIFLFTLVQPYPRFPFIFISGYPFWGSVLFINSGAFLITLKRKMTKTLMKASQIMNSLSVLGAIAGIILLIFGFLLDQNYICGYSQESDECDAITVIFTRTMLVRNVVEEHCENKDVL